MIDIAEHVNNLAKHCHEISKEAGWWTAMDGSPLQDNPFTPSNKMLLMVTEIAEMCEGDRKDTFDSHLPHRKTVEVEAADLLIRLMDYCGAYGLDIGGAVVEKMVYNLTRQDHTKQARESAGGKKY